MSKLPMFHDGVPEWLRFPLLIVLPFVYQCSNPVYMNIAAEVMSDTALRQSDVMMCGFACILGITMTFPLLFRLKFRFTTRQIIIACSTGIAVLTVLTTYVTWLPLLVAMSFLFGMLKVWGTFECMSSMMQVISPNMHLAPFLAVVFLAVFGGVELGGLASTYISHYLTWRHVSAILVAVHVVVLLFALLLLRDFRFQPAVPLRGIDWMGMVLWSIFLVGLTAVFVYGEEVEWMHAPSLRMCLLISVVALIAAVARMHRVQAPFIAPQCFHYRNLWPIMVLFFVSGVMLCSQTVLQGALLGGVLRFDSLHISDLNWAILAGVAVGCLVGRWGLTGLGWGYKQLTALSIALTAMYAAAMYFLVGTGSPLRAFIVPCFFSGIGHALIFVVLTTYVESNTPFEHRFMMLTVLGLVRTGVASPIGVALFSHSLRAQMASNMALLGSGPTVVADPSLVTQQALALGVRNLFGLTVMLGVVTLVVLMASRFDSKRYITLPTMRRIYTLLSDEEQ